MREEVYKAMLPNTQVFSDLMLFHLAHFTRLSKALDVFNSGSGSSYSSRIPL